MKHLTSKKLNRVLAFALAVILTLTPAFGGSVFAADDGMVSQIVSNGQVVTTADGQVRHSKIIRQTGENTFDITLKVETQEIIEEQSASKDAAVVLVLDVSNSMESGDIRSMKQAAKNFVDAFVKDAGKGLRYVSIVLFGSNGATILGWTDANGNLRTVKSKIDGISGTDGGTNIEAGLRLANNLLADRTVTSIDNKYVVLMTDGVPTFHVSDNNETNSTTSMTGTRGGGNVAEEADYHDITCSGTSGDGNDGRGKGKHNYQHAAGDNLPQQIKNKGAKLYTVTYKGDNVTGKVNGQSISSWLASFATQNINAGADIFNGLSSVASIIVNQAQAWILTDPMGAYIDFGSNSSIARVTNATVDSSDAVRKFNTDTNTLIWNLKSDMSRTGPVNGWYTYSLSYSIRLDNAAEGFVSGADYAANGTTSLTYMITRNNQLVDTLYTTDLVVPVVEGYLADLRFVKVDADSGEALAGAKFSLNGEEAISDENGVVSFTGIPSGYAYTLREIAAPEGYQRSDKTWNVTVSYGTLTVDGDAAADLTIENEIIPPATTEATTTETTTTEVTTTEEEPPVVTTEATTTETTTTEVTTTEEEPPVVTTEATTTETTTTEVTTTEEEPPVVTTEATTTETTATEVTTTEEEPPATTTRRPVIIIIRTSKVTTTEATTTATTEEEPPAITEVTTTEETTVVTTAEEPPVVTEVTTTEETTVVTTTEETTVVTTTEETTVVTTTEEPPVVTEATTEEEIVITEVSVPLDDGKDPVETTEEEIVIEEPEVPLDDGNDIPYTGDTGSAKAIVLAAVMVFAAVGMAILWISGKKPNKQ